MSKHLSAKIKNTYERLTLYYKKHFKIFVHYITKYFNKFSFLENIWEIENVWIIRCSMNSALLSHLVYDIYVVCVYTHTYIFHIVYTVIGKYKNFWYLKFTWEPYSRCSEKSSYCFMQGSDMIRIHFTGSCCYTVENALWTRLVRSWFLVATPPQKKDDGGQEKGI